MAASVDWSDPCARAVALRDAYFRLVSGQQESVVRYQANGTEREVRYQSADHAALHDAWREAERTCQAARGRPARPNTIRVATSKGV
jgi:hypothetical protein